MLKTTYTLAEVADMLSCHAETLRRAIRDGSLRAARLGREYRISRADLEAFWVVQGGGELFTGEASAAPPPPSPADEHLKTRKKPHGPQQLSLFIPEEKP